MVIGSSILRTKSGNRDGGGVYFRGPEQTMLNPYLKVGTEKLEKYETVTRVSNSTDNLRNGRLKC